MQWKSLQDRTSILQSATGKRDQETVELAEKIAQHIEAGGSFIDFEPSTVYHPDQISNALLLLVSHFDKGKLLFESMPWVARQLVIFQSALVVEHQRRYAASSGHKGEADEGVG